MRQVLISRGPEAALGKFSHSDNLRFSGPIRSTWGLLPVLPYLITYPVLDRGNLSRFSAMPLPTGTKLGSYEVLSAIVAGGVGAIPPRMIGRKLVLRETTWAGLLRPASCAQEYPR